MKRGLFLAAVMAAATMPGTMFAQGLDPASLTKPATDSWPTYAGDYSGKRFSSLNQINQTTGKNIGLAWVSHLTSAPGTGNPSIPGGPGHPATFVGGETDEPVPVRGGGHI